MGNDLEAENVKEVYLWRLKWGRISTFTDLLAAESFDGAVNLAVEAMKSRKPEWKPNASDIASLERLDSVVVAA